LEGKTTLVTGAGRGIGKGIALAFADQGSDVVAVARTVAEVEETAAEVRTRGRKALALSCDVCDPGSVRSVVDAALREFGKVDILVNNAGYARFEPLKDTSLEEWQRHLDVNLTGPFRCVKAVLPSMMKRREGRIINISSVAGLKPYLNQGAYCASKHGLNGLSTVLAAELREYNIGVHAVCPGAVPTKLTHEVMPERDMSDWMAPEDIAHACLYLATLSPRATTDVLALRRFAGKP
jgi:NAD(P)-dependent dehydrogenase (short-subunit alcohol dehydrogenase family)